MEIKEKTEVSSKKKQITKITAVFFGGMLLLTFFSNTLNNFMLPKVTSETPSGGALIKQVKGNGIVEAKKYDNFYAAAGIVVLEIMVKTGDHVKEGQSLIKLDVSSIKNELEDEKARLRQKRLVIDGLNDENSLLSYTKTVSDAQLDLDNAVRSYEKAVSKLKDEEELYQAGAEPKSDVEAAQTEVDNAKLTYERAKVNHDSAVASKLKAAGDNKKSIEAAQYDIEIAQRKIKELEEKTRLQTVTAKSDGIVVTLNAVEGELTDSSKPLYRIAELSKGFRFVFTTDAKSAGNLKPGDTGDITINALGSEPVQGTVAEVVDNQESKGEKKDIYMDIPSDGLTGGETGSADIRKNTDAFEILVSNNAIGQDSGGNFVYVLKYRKGPLGNEYYIRKVKITTSDDDDYKTAVISGLTGSDVVVTDSDKQLSDGIRVLSENEEVEN
jgi:Multidrug resistance efflux pump